MAANHWVSETLKYDIGAGNALLYKFLVGNGESRDFEISNVLYITLGIDPKEQACNTQSLNLTAYN